MSKKVKYRLSIEDLMEKWDKIAEMPTEPDLENFPYHIITSYIDESKSARWNREEVERRNDAYEMEELRLLDAYNKEYHKFEDLCIQFIVDWGGCNRAQADVLYRKIHKSYQRFNYDFFVLLHKETMFIYDFMKAGRRKNASYN